MSRERRLEHVKQDRCSDVVGDVADDHEWAFNEGRGSNVQHVVFNDCHGGIAGVPLTQLCCERPIYLDCNERSTAARENIRQRAAAGANLDNGVARFRVRSICNRVERRQVEQKVLTETLENRRVSPLAGNRQLRRTSRVRSSGFAEPAL